MAPVQSRIDSSASSNLLPYRIIVGITGALLVLVLILLAHTYHRLRGAYHNNTILSQLSSRLRSFLADRDMQIFELEEYNEHLRLVAHDLENKFVVDEDGEEDLVVMEMRSQEDMMEPEPYFVGFSGVGAAEEVAIDMGRD